VSRKSETQHPYTAPSVDSPLDAATLRNLALQPHLPALSEEVVDFSSIVELLPKLSSTNLLLVTNIIRVILDEQARVG
jgi:hypothetical protein